MNAECEFSYLRQRTNFHFFVYLECCAQISPEETYNTQTFCIQLFWRWYSTNYERDWRWNKTRGELKANDIFWNGVEDVAIDVAKIVWPLNIPRNGDIRPMCLILMLRRNLYLFKDYLIIILFIYLFILAFKLRNIVWWMNEFFL